MDEGAYLKLINYDLEEHNKETIMPRQDRIEQFAGFLKENIHGIIPDFREYDLLHISTLIPFSANFNFFQECNKKNYLTQCLVMAHALSGYFNESMEMITDVINDKFYEHESKEDQENFQDIKVKLICHNVLSEEQQL